MRLRARVREHTGATRHIVNGTERSRDIATVEIAETGGGAFYLLYFDDAGKGITDTWHLSIEGAKGQAELEFNIIEADWESIE